MAASDVVPGRDTRCVAVTRSGRRLMLMRTLLLSLGIALFPGIAFSHALSGSYLTLNADSRARQLEGRWEIRIADLNDALNLDSDGDGAVTWADLDREAPRTFEYVLAHLTVQRGRANCALARARQLLDERSDGYYLALYFAGRCPPGEARWRWSRACSLIATPRIACC